MFFIQNILSPTCIKCGSFFIEEHLFCDYCFKRAIEARLEKTSDGSHIKDHVYLFDWNNGDEEVFDQLVYRLKANQSTEAIKFYGKLLADKLENAMDMTRFAGFIPIPGSKANRRHAELIAFSLAEQLGLNVFNVLEKSGGTKQQKRLSAEERKMQNPFELKNPVPEDFTASQAEADLDGQNKERSYILVDDVLTTGQTIKHCESRLLRAKRNAVVTLFYRPSLRR